METFEASSEKKFNEAQQAHEAKKKVFEELEKGPQTWKTQMTRDEEEHVPTVRDRRTPTQAELEIYSYENKQRGVLLLPASLNISWKGTA